MKNKLLFVLLMVWSIGFMCYWFLTSLMHFFDISVVILVMLILVKIVMILLDSGVVKVQVRIVEKDDNTTVTILEFDPCKSPPVQLPREDVFYMPYKHCKLFIGDTICEMRTKDAQGDVSKSYYKYQYKAHKEREFKKIFEMMPVYYYRTNYLS